MNEGAELVNLLAARDDSDSLRRVSKAASSVTAQNYEQISVKEILQRFRQKSVRQSKSFRDVNQNDVLEDIQDYAVEAPKSGLVHRDEVLPPLFLPTQCESEGSDLTNAGQQTKANNLNSKKYKEKRETIYMDTKQWLEMAEERNKAKEKGAKLGLVFESNFECGNLSMAESAVKKGAPFGAPEEYDLYLKTDPSTEGSIPTAYAQWFLFRVSNTKKRSYRFHIHNFSKPNIGYLDGMKPLVLSQCQYNEEGKGWQRVGEEIRYTPCERSPLQPIQSHFYHCSKHYKSFTLSFTFHCAYAKDVIYFAFAPPYTYSQLQNMIYICSKNPLNKPHMKVRTICRSLAGNRHDLIIITEKSTLVRNDFDIQTIPEEYNIPKLFYQEMMKYNLKDVLPADLSPKEERKYDSKTIRPSISVEAIAEEESAPLSDMPKFLKKVEEDMQDEQEANKKRRLAKVRKLAVVIIARVYPAETCSSWMCEGIIKFLLGTDEYAQLLRTKFVFYIFPMINPDGVVNGFSRSDLRGKEIHDHWQEESAEKLPIQHYIKKLLQNLSKTTSIAAYIDLRGHSSKDGAFIYSILKERIAEIERLEQANAPVKKNHMIPSGTAPNDHDPRQFFIAMAQRCKHITLKNCSLAINTEKRATGLLYMIKEHRIPLSVAILASQVKGPKGSQLGKRHPTPLDYAKIGMDAIISLDQVYGIDYDEKEVKSKVKSIDSVRVSAHFRSIDMAEIISYVANAEKSAPFEPGLASLAEKPMRNRSIMAMAAQRKRSFLIGSTDFEESLALPFMQVPKQLTSDEIHDIAQANQTRMLNQMVRKSIVNNRELVEADLFDVSKDIDFNESRWENRSNASTDGAYDYGADSDGLIDETIDFMTEEHTIRAMRRAEFLRLLSPASSLGLQNYVGNTEKVYRQIVSAPSFNTVPVLAQGKILKEISISKAGESFQFEGLKPQIMETMKGDKKGIIVAEFGTALPAAKKYRGGSLLMTQQSLESRSQEDNTLDKIKEFLASSAFASLSMDFKEEENISAEQPKSPSILKVKGIDFPSKGDVKDAKLGDDEVKTDETDKVVSRVSPFRKRSILPPTGKFASNSSSHKSSTRNSVSISPCHDSQTAESNNSPNRRKSSFKDDVYSSAVRRRSVTSPRLFSDSISVDAREEEEDLLSNYTPGKFQREELQLAVRDTSALLARALNDSVMEQMASEEQRPDADDEKPIYNQRPFGFLQSLPPSPLKQPNPLLIKQSSANEDTANLSDDESIDIDRYKVSYSPHLNTAMISSAFGGQFVASLDTKTEVEVEEIVERKDENKLEFPRRRTVLIKEYEQKEETQEAPSTPSTAPAVAELPTRDELQDQFMQEMGLDYDYLFGGQGFIKDLAVHYRSPQDGWEKPKKTHKVARDGTYYNGFPLRRKHVGYIDSFVSPADIHRARGVGDICSVYENKSLVQYQLLKYYQHLEERLRLTSLVSSEEEVKKTAMEMFQAVIMHSSQHPIALPHALHPYSKAKAAPPRSKKDTHSPRAPSPSQIIPSQLSPGGTLEEPSLSLAERLSRLKDIQEQNADQVSLPVWIPEPLRSILLKGQVESGTAHIETRQWMASLKQREAPSARSPSPPFSPDPLPLLAEHYDAYVQPIPPSAFSSALGSELHSASIALSSTTGKGAHPLSVYTLSPDLLPFPSQPLKKPIRSSHSSHSKAKHRPSPPPSPIAPSSPLSARKKGEGRHVLYKIGTDTFSLPPLSSEKRETDREDSTHGRRPPPHFAKKGGGEREALGDRVGDRARVGKWASLPKRKETPPLVEEKKEEEDGDHDDDDEEEEEEEEEQQQMHWPYNFYKNQLGEEQREREEKQKEERRASPSLLRSVLVGRGKRSRTIRVAEKAKDSFPRRPAEPRPSITGGRGVSFSFPRERLLTNVS